MTTPKVLLQFGLYFRIQMVSFSLKRTSLLLSVTGLSEQRAERGLAERGSPEEGVAEDVQRPALFWLSPLQQ